MVSILIHAKDTYIEPGQWRNALEVATAVVDTPYSRNAAKEKVNELHRGDQYLKTGICK